MVVKFPCGICHKPVGVKHKAICCDLCDKWIHTACNNLDKKTYKNLQESNTSWFCINCVKKELPFTTQTDFQLENIYKGKHIVPFKSSDLENFTDQINMRIRDPTDSNFFEQDSLYYDLKEFNNLNNKFNQFSLLHLNISSLQYHFEELNDLLETSNTKFSVIGITESRLKKGTKPISNIDLPNYKIEHTPTESEKGGSLLYISNNLNYKIRNDLMLYKPKELESIFIEILTKKNEKNIIIGCIYKHPKMPITEFNDDFLSPVLEKTSFEKKDIYLMGDFNINLLNYETDRPTATFLDNMYSNSFVPYITLPTRITPRSKTLINNIFFNNSYDSITSGNLITDISDHLAQFFITPNILEKGPKSRSYK